MLLDVSGVAAAKEFRTSDVLLCPGGILAGDASKVEAARDGVSAGRDSGVSQNMYMNPSSSDSENGFANSDNNNAVV